jgi:hypothetical protein
MRKLVWLGLCLGGCSVFADRSDYHAYREIRLADDDSRRVEALRAYLDAHPDGRWAPEVREENERADSAHWLAMNESCDGISRYLVLFPNGSFRTEAGDLYRARRCGQPVRTGDDGPEWVGQVLGYWLAQLESIEGWGEPLGVVAQRNPDFSRLFGELGARPVCTPTQCVKPISSPYFIPVPGAQRLDRENALYVRLSLRDGRLIGAELLLAEHGFSRWFERERRTIITDEAPDDRALAASFALERLAAVVPAGFESAEAPALAPLELTPFGSCEPVVAAGAIAAPAQPVVIPDEPEGDSSLEALMEGATRSTPAVLPDPVEPRVGPPVATTPAAVAPPVEAPVVLGAYTSNRLHAAVFRDAIRCDERFDGIAISPRSGGSPKIR